MPTFSPAPQSVKDLALAIIEEFSNHAPLLKYGVTVDYVFAHADLDDKTGEKIHNAISSRGFRVLGQAKKMPLKDRAMGRADAEITLDADHWNDIRVEERKALLDHEITHLEVMEDERGVLLDDLERPRLKLRHHDIEEGFFHIVASRHGEHSIERIQSKFLVDAFGQYYLPGLVAANEHLNQQNGTVTVQTGGKSVTVSQKRFSQIGKEASEAMAK